MDGVNNQKQRGRSVTVWKLMDGRERKRMKRNEDEDERDGEREITRLKRKKHCILNFDHDLASRYLE